jgi:hypothetical protein
LRKVLLDPSRRGRTRLSRGARRIGGSFAGWLLRALSRPLISPALAIFMVAVSAGFALHGLLTPLRTDYIAMLSGARVLADGGCLYCHAAQLQAQAVLLGHPHPAWDPFLDTPLVALVYRPLLALPAAAGFAAFLAASAACVALAGVLLWRRMGLAIHGTAGLLLLALALASVPAAWNYRLGQTDALLVLPLVAGTVLLVADRRFVAGLLFSLLLLKPQTICLLPVALLVVGEWRVVVGMAGRRLALAGRAGRDRPVAHAPRVRGTGRRHQRWPIRGHRQPGGQRGRLRRRCGAGAPHVCLDVLATAYPHRPAPSGRGAGDRRLPSARPPRLRL